MSKRTAMLLVLALCLFPGRIPWAADSVPTDTTWMTVRLGGRKIGHLRIDRVRDGDTVTTSQDLEIEFDRNGKRIPLRVMTRSRETSAGRPLAFYSLSTLSSSDSIVEGKQLPNGNYAVTTTVGGVARETTLAWPPGALLSEGQRLTLLRAASHPGAHFTLRMFDPASQTVAEVEMSVLGQERVSLPDGTVTLGHQRETLQTPRGIQRMDLWLDARGQTRKGLLSMLGQPLEMLACDEACAMAPVQSVDMFRASMVDSPRALSPGQRDAFLRYRIHVPAGTAQPVIDTDEQRVVDLGHGDWEVDIGRAQSGGEAPPQPEDIRPNAWVQSDAPAIRALAARVVGPARDDLRKMRLLRHFVSAYVTAHGLDVGYASALEVLQTHEGDCTEFAVLLAALARAERIPTRVVTGMVYADRYGDSTHVFVPHAWVQAWINGRWQSFDAALRQFDNTHIALDMGDGDPWHFFNTADLFGQIRIEAITPATALADPPRSPLAGAGR